MKSRARSGFSMFDLLVIIAIIGILIGLLVPALLKARETAGRAKRTNSLKQLGLACHNYYSTYELLPPGNDKNGFSAATYLLPFVEELNLYQRVDFKKPITDKANAAARKTAIKLFLSDEDLVKAVSKEYGATNYLFNAGSKPSLIDNNGIFFQDSKVRLTDILDGTSNTIMIGETLKGDGNKEGRDVRRQYVLLKKEELKELKDEAGIKEFKDGKNLASDRCASWMDGSFLQGTFTTTRTANDERPDVSCAGAGGLSGLRSLDTIVVIALCDGSVHVVKKNIRLDIWKALGSRNGGEAVDADF